MTDLTRRSVVAGASATAAAALAATPASAQRRRAGIAPEAQEAVGVIGTLVQDGLAMTGFGWLTHVEGVPDDALYTDPATHSAETARLTWYAEAEVTGRDFLPNLFSATATGRLRIYAQPDGGAVADEPASFAAGRRIANHDATFRNVLTVIAPDQAVTEVTGDLRQRSAAEFRLAGRTLRLGRRNLEQRLLASGPGTRTEPAIPRATFHVAGSLVIPA